jgi:coenzyme F420-0:L-glutamate ligase/coenzyme F420-1:gamma-L-glutamate ligase
MAAPASFLELARSRRTARTHAPAAIPEAAIDSVLEAARWAPSAANRQPWEFVVIRDPALKQALRQAFLAEAGDAAHGDKYRSVTEKQADLLLAPGLILVCGDPGTKARYINAEEIGAAVQEELFLLSMGAAIQNMLLAATAAGLTSTWIARPARIAAIQALLRVPERLRTVAFVGLGMAEAPARWSEQMRNPVKRHTDRFGAA